MKNISDRVPCTWYSKVSLLWNFTPRIATLGLAQMETPDKTTSPWGGFTVLDLLTTKALVLLGISTVHQWLLEILHHLSHTVHTSARVTCTTSRRPAHESCTDATEPPLLLSSRVWMCCNSIDPSSVFSVICDVMDYIKNVFEPTWIISWIVNYCSRTIIINWKFRESSRFVQFENLFSSELHVVNI